MFLIAWITFFLPLTIRHFPVAHLGQIKPFSPKEPQQFADNGQHELCQINGVLSQMLLLDGGAGAPYPAPFCSQTPPGARCSQQMWELVTWKVLLGKLLILLLGSLAPFTHPSPTREVESPSAHLMPCSHLTELGESEISKQIKQLDFHILISCLLHPPLKHITALLGHRKSDDTEQLYSIYPAFNSESL